MKPSAARDRASGHVLEVEDLTVQFAGGATPVVNCISFDVKAGETVALVGESGSGKSVTALSVMGLLPAQGVRTTGRILLEGRNLLALADDQMRKVRGQAVSMIFQEPMTSLNPVMSIGEQLIEAIVTHRPVSRTEARRAALGLLEKVHIPAAATRLSEYPHRLSGGMRQRAMIAMALACEPGLLIADEPTTALDVTIQAQIIDLIKEIQEEEGMSVLFITHDMGVVAEVADRMVIMYRGDVVEHGATAKILSSPVQPYTKALLASVPVLGSMKGRTAPTTMPIVDKVSGERRPERTITWSRSEGDDAILRVDGLNTRFVLRKGIFGLAKAKINAVQDVSFDIGRGETLSLVGESGCGKSTTGRSIVRLVEPASGRILLNGKDLSVKAHLQDARRSIQMIFQDPLASLNPRMRVGDAIAERIVDSGIARGKEAKAIVEDLMEKVGLQPEMASRFPHQFSGGQRQRICIARSLASNPQIIIADEAVSALDVSVKAEIINLFLELQEKIGLSYLFISHDMAVVERVSHRVAVMYFGRIVEMGPREAIFSDPQHPYTRTLLSAVPVMDPARRSMRHRREGGPEGRQQLRGLDDEPLPMRYRQVSPGHVVAIGEQD